MFRQEGKEYLLGIKRGGQKLQVKVRLRRLRQAAADNGMCPTPLHGASQVNGPRSHRTVILTLGVCLISDACAPLIISSAQQSDGVSPGRLRPCDVD